jgi:hypothetical protein
LTQEEPQGDGSVVVSDIPECTPDWELPSPGDDVCFVALTGDDVSDTCTDADSNLEFVLVRREGSAPNGGTTIRADCELTTECPP